MASIVIRMVLSDVLMFVGIIVFVYSGGFAESLTPTVVVALAAAVVGFVGSTWMSLSLARYLRERRRLVQPETEEEPAVDESDHRQW